MKKSIFINLDNIFGPVIPHPMHSEDDRHILFNSADLAFRKRGNQSIIEQQHKGRYCYLHHVELNLEASIAMNIEITMNDLYAVYVLVAQKSVNLRDEQQQRVFKLAPSRGIYVYLPKGNYQLLVGAGSYQIFSFYFDVGVLDGINDRDIDFIGHLRNAKKAKSNEVQTSVDFPAGPLTRTVISQIASNLTKGHLDSQVSLLTEIKELIRLSQQKVQHQNLLHPHYGISIDSVKRLIENGVNQQGAKFDLQSLLSDLPFTLPHANNLFLQKYGMTLTAYKKYCLIQLSIPLLIRKVPIITICEDLGFTSESTFYRMFKKVKGMSTREYVQRNFPML